MLNYYQQFLIQLSSKTRTSILLNNIPSVRYNQLIIFENSNENLLVKDDMSVRIKNLRKVSFNDSTFNLSEPEREITLMNELKCKKEDIFYLEFSNGIGKDIKVKYPIAYYKDNKLYIYWNFLGHTESTTNIKILKWIVTESIKKVKLQKEKPSNTVTQEVQELVMKLKKQKITDNENTINNLNENISDAMQRISSCKEQVYSLNESTNIIEKGNDKLKKEIKKNLEIIKSHKEIRNIKTLNNTIHVFTHPITLTVQLDNDNKRLFEIGSFEIIINIHNNTIQVFNELLNTDNSNSEFGYDHPHILRGNPCWGNLTKIIPELLAKNDLLSLVNITIEFLHSYLQNDQHISPYRIMDVIGTKSKKEKKSKNKRRVAKTDTHDTPPIPISNNEEDDDDDGEYPFSTNSSTSLN